MCDLNYILLSGSEFQNSFTYSAKKMASEVCPEIEHKDLSKKNYLTVSKAVCIANFGKAER